MRRTIFLSLTTIVFLMIIAGLAFAQDFMIRESDPDVVALSRATDDNPNVFSDTDNDGIYDTMLLYGEEISANINPADAEGFQYEDERYVAFYPSDWTGLPDEGTAEILGFMHYFNEEGTVSTFIAIVAEQAFGDDTTNGLGVYFYDACGLRVGAPTTMFMEKARLRAIPIYQEWVQMAKDFGIGSTPANSQFFVLAKDLGLSDYVLIIMYQLYQ